MKQNDESYVQSAHTVPLTEEGIRCITNNYSTCPINAAFLKALEDNNITPAMWNLAKNIEAG
jgi:hypothetical protein